MRRDGDPDPMTLFFEGGQIVTIPVAGPLRPFRYEEPGGGRAPKPKTTRRRNKRRWGIEDEYRFCMDDDIA